MNSVWDTAAALETNQQSFVIATVIGSKGSAPQDLGAKIIVVKSGLHWGTVGGGKVEAKVISYAQNLIATSHAAPVSETWNLQKDIGMSCGGEMTFLFECHPPSLWDVVIFGAGHVSQALCRLMSNLNCQVTCIDPRAEWLEKLPNQLRLTKILAERPEEHVKVFSENAYFVVMTQGHATDLPILKNLYSLFPDANYIGAIGSDIKATKLRAELKSFGVTENTLKNFACPIGMKLGTNHPFEIAISVSAQLLQARDLKLSSMKETEKPIFEATFVEML